MSQGNEEMRSEYDIRGGVRGKYFQQYRVHVECEWLQPPQTSESRGQHPPQSTVWIGAGPIYVTQTVVGEPVLQ